MKIVLYIYESPENVEVGLYISFDFILDRDEKKLNELCDLCLNQGKTIQLVPEKIDYSKGVDL